MATVSYDFRTKAEPDRVYKAVSTQEGFAGWWTRTCTVDSRIGGEAEFRFYQGEAVMVFRFDELDPGRSVKMTCIRTVNKNPARQADKWHGTTLEFQLQALEDGGGEVRLRHHGWPEDSPALPQVKQGWGHFVNSLQAYLETGQGTPYDDPA